MLNFGLFHAAYTRGARATSEGTLQDLERRSWTIGHDLNRAVRKVGHPTPEIEAMRLP